MSDYKNCQDPMSWECQKCDNEFEKSWHSVNRKGRKICTNSECD